MGAAGRDVNLLDAPLQNIAFRDNGNVYGIAEGRWAYYPEQGIDTRATATYPRLSLQDNSNNYRNSTLWKRAATSSSCATWNWDTLSRSRR